MRQEDRLTHEYANGPKYNFRQGRALTHWSPATKTELMERLAAYEDLGLKPEEIRQLMSDQGKEQPAAQKAEAVCDCRGCRHHLGGGCCRANLEAECGCGNYEAWEPRLEGGVSGDY